MIFTKPFYAVNEKGEYWKKNPHPNDQYIAMLPDGTLLVITYNKADGHYARPLVGYKATFDPPAEIESIPVTKCTCPNCDGKGKCSQIVSHDDEGAIWEPGICDRCQGAGEIVVDTK